MPRTCKRCGHNLRSDNRSGYCRAHTPRAGVFSYSTCACGSALGKDNRSGRCRKCNMAAQGRVHGGKIGAANHAWTGGRVVKEGYVKIKMPGHHRSDVRGYVFEHILVVEQAMGRLLNDEECVHHDNEQTADNRPENLWVFANVGYHSAYHRWGSLAGLVWRGDGGHIPNAEAS